MSPTEGTLKTDFATDSTPTKISEDIIVAQRTPPWKEHIFYVGFPNETYGCNTLKCVILRQEFDEMFVNEPLNDFADELCHLETKEVVPIFNDGER